MKIISTLGFDAQTTNGILPKTTNPQPIVTNDGTVANLPAPIEGVLFLVNARVFSASDRQDLVMFDAAQTQRNSEGLATAQGGYVMRDGSTHTF